HDDTFGLLLNMPAGGFRQAVKTGQRTVVETSMLPWTALEYGQIPCAAAASSSATARSTPGRLTLRLARRKNELPSRLGSIWVSTAGCSGSFTLRWAAASSIAPR